MDNQVAAPPVATPPRTAGLSIKELLSGHIELASPPEVFLKVSEILDHPKKNAKDAEQAIEHDPGLATRILKVVNSAYYNFPMRIHSLRHAISIIGSQELRKLILATTIADKFSALPGGLLSMREFWSQSVYCALYASALAAQHQDCRNLKDIFCCGLLHEIGRLVIYGRLPELARAAGLLATSEDIREIQAQRQTMGFDHYQVGAELIRLWHLPEAIATSMDYYLEPLKAPEHQTETTIIHLAHQLSSTRLEKSEATELTTLRQSFAWSHLDIPVEALDIILLEVDVQFDEVFQTIFQP